MVATGKKYISQMSGLGRVMPVTFLAFLLGSMSVIGLPPTGGFFSKWNLLLGAVNSDQIGFMVVLLVSSLLNAMYFLPIVFRGFFGENQHPEEEPGVREAPLCCVFPLAITAAGSVFLFFYPDIFVNLTRLALGQ
jgi:multicomponent Na+:H+ antiporter subunit D